MAVLGTHGGSTHQYVLIDHLGTPRAIVHPGSNAILWRWDLTTSAFGDHAANQDPDGNGVAYTFHLRYPGQYYDEDTGLHYNYFRDYDPSTGRYLQSDPIGLAGGISTFQYVESDPFLKQDRFGLSPLPGSAFPVDVASLEKVKVRQGMTASELNEQLRVNCSSYHGACGVEMSDLFNAWLTAVSVPIPVKGFPIAAKACRVENAVAKVCIGIGLCSSANDVAVATRMNQLGKVDLPDEIASDLANASERSYLAEILSKLRGTRVEQYPPPP